MNNDQVLHLLYRVGESFEKILDPDPDAHDFRNLNAFCLKYISGKIFMNIRSIVLREIAKRRIEGQTNKETDKQTNAG